MENLNIVNCIGRWDNDTDWELLVNGVVKANWSIINYELESTTYTISDDEAKEIIEQYGFE